MKLGRNILDIMIWGLVCSILLPSTAYAYLDAGTGSQIIQIIIATCVGGIFALKMSYKRIRAFFSSRFSKSKREEDNI